MDRSEGYSATQRRNAKRLKKLAEEELGARPAHHLCLRIVADDPPRPGDTPELYICRLFESNRAALEESCRNR